MDKRPKMDNRKMDNRPIWIKYLDNRLASFELISTAYPKTTDSFKNAMSQSAEMRTVTRLGVVDSRSL